MAIFSVPSVSPWLFLLPGGFRRAARRLSRFLLPSFDLFLLQRCRCLRFIEPGTRVLDAGCGDGTVAFLLLRRGCRVVGVSNDAGPIARLRDHCDAASLPAEAIDFRVHDLARDGPVPPLPSSKPPLPSGEGWGEGPPSEAAPSSDTRASATAPHPPLSRRERGKQQEQGRGETGGFDAAVCFDVLEHILDDRAALANVAGSLRQGGTLLLTVPDRAAPPLWGDVVSAVEDGGHVRLGYTSAELEALLREAGLKPIRRAAFGGLLTRKATNASRRLERRAGAAFAILRFLWLLIMRPLGWLDALIPGPRYELFVLAEKNPQSVTGTK